MLSLPLVRATPWLIGLSISCGASSALAEGEPPAAPARVESSAFLRKFEPLGNGLGNGPMASPLVSAAAYDAFVRYQSLGRDGGRRTGLVPALRLVRGGFRAVVVGFF